MELAAPELAAMHNPKGGSSKLKGRYASVWRDGIAGGNLPGNRPNPFRRADRSEEAATFRERLNPMIARSNSGTEIWVDPFVKIL